MGRVGLVAKNTSFPVFPYLLGNDESEANQDGESSEFAKCEVELVLVLIAARKEGEIPLMLSEKDGKRTFWWYK